MGSRNRIRGERDCPIAVRLVRLPPAGRIDRALRNCVGPASLRAAEYTPEKSTDITWVAPEDVRRAAQMFATERPSGYESWTGTEMHSGTLQMNRAIQCFYALTGQFDAQGSNAEFAPAPSNPITAAEFLPPGRLTNDLDWPTIRWDHPATPATFSIRRSTERFSTRTPIQSGG